MWRYEVQTFGEPGRWHWIVTAYSDLSTWTPIIADGFARTRLGAWLAGRLWIRRTVRQ
jgi:hypothetical protein